VTAALLHQREQRAILRPQLAERMAQGVELFGIDRAGRLGNFFVLFTEGQKDTRNFCRRS
jgi:hypothetical protein